MTIIEIGHKFLMQSFDGNGLPESIKFMKRVGNKYPYNFTSHPGTNCQEVIRVLISRVKFLEFQRHHWANKFIILNFRIALNLFEYRAAKHHKRKFRLKWAIENLPVNAVDGHIRY